MMERAAVEKLFFFNFFKFLEVRFDVVFIFYCDLVDFVVFFLIDHRHAFT